MPEVTLVPDHNGVPRLHPRPIPGEGGNAIDHGLGVLSDLATAQAAAIAGVQGAQTATAATVATHTANTNAHGLSEVRSQIAALVAEVDGIDTTIDSYLHVQSTPSAVWTINHNMGKYPSVTVIDSAGSTLYGDYFYPNENTVTLTFSGGFSGKASLR